MLFWENQSSGIRQGRDCLVGETVAKKKVASYETVSGEIAVQEVWDKNGAAEKGK